MTSIENNCPIETKSHFEHDEKIRELTQELDILKFATERTPRLLALRIIQLEKSLASPSTPKSNERLLAEISRLKQENTNLIKQMNEIQETLKAAVL